MRLSADYWWVIGVGVVLTLARFSEAFLVLKGRAAGLPLALVPVVMVVMNVVYAATSAPAGALSDRIGRRPVLVAGLAALACADLALALMPGLAGLFVGVSLWGLYMWLTQGLLSALVADTAPEDLRGTAFGIFNLATAAALLAASGIAGLFWDRYGPSSTFLVGAVFAALAAAGLTLRRRQA
ncbi:MFS transporter [Phenylobacterium montanum]|uniref:MFS transporter n=1 Tax=Phenylobacterium montanum TaxID=2823693 RepID=UPI00201300AB|nr:MFS transporter [Caulobacter sp. S6]